ncbi:MAG: hypothetical protein IKV88_02005, partial [Clostridia bacterium]|nr:hypothetical protein [Clostridia bacterium]
IIKLKSLNVRIVFDIDSRSAFHTIYHEMGHLQDMQPRCDAIHKYNYEYDKYPNELKDWVDNQEYMQTANRVSGYAAHGPGEFIAETFADLIEGKNVKKEVLDLYKKLKGPMLPEME